MKAEDQHPASPVQVNVDARRHPRFSLQVDIVIHSRTCGTLKGYTLDISESGVSALLTMEVPLDEIVDLSLKLPCGRVDILATVRERSAFRYGFQFLELGPASEIIRNTCRQLALEQS